MNWMYKLEQKWGKYAIYDLHKYFVGIYFIGYLLSRIEGITSYLTFSIPHILQGQVWRLISWVLVSQGGGVLGILFMLCLIPMGRHLEFFLGTFKMNVYLFGGVLLNIVGATLVYFGSWLIIGTPLPVDLSMYYILLTTFMALALCIPNATVNLYFILPIKMKWMLVVYYLELLFELHLYYSAGAAYDVQTGIIFVLMGGSQIIFALLNLALFFFFAKIRVGGKQKKRQKEFQSQMRQAVNTQSVSRHKCAICGRTEKDSPDLTFRYCSKCTGNKEYCQDHLFTHTHN